MRSYQLRCRALVADDDAMNRRLLHRILETAGFEVVLAEDGMTAVAAIERQEPGVAIIDLRMPGWDGLETLKRIRAVAPKLPAIVLTGNGDVRSAVDAIKLGAADFIMRPVANDALVAAIERALDDRTNRVALSQSYSADSDWRVQAVLRYVEVGHAEGGCCLAEIAKRLRSSKSHLSRLLVKDTGQTFTDLLQSTRMRVAAKLLRDTNLSVKEIAARTGYAHVPSFVRSVRRSFQMTPGELRRRGHDGVSPTAPPVSGTRSEVVVA